MIFELMLKFMSIDEIDAYYGKKKDFLLFSDKQIKKFFEKCLNEKFDSKIYNTYLFYKCMTIYSYGLTEKDLDSMFFKTMPVDYKINFILNYILPLKIVKSMIDRIDGKDFALVSLDDLIELLRKFPDLDIEKKIANHDNLPVLIISCGLICSWATIKRKISLLRSLLSREDFAELCIKTNINFYFIFDELTDDNNKDLDLLFTIVLNKKDETNIAVEEKTFRRIPCYEQFINCIKAHEIRFNKEEREFLVKKLIESKNYPKMYDWLSNVNWEENKMLIDELLDKSTEFYLLYCVDNQFIPYTIEKYLNGPEINKSGVPVLDAMFLGIFDIEKLECILKSIYEIKPDVKFSKKTVMSLLRQGVSYFPSLITSYEFSEEERLEIFEGLKEEELYDLCSYYGAYLLSGDKSKLISQEMVLKYTKNVKRK